MTSPEALAEYFSNDPVFARLLTSWRFVLFDNAVDSTEKATLQKLGAKRLVGSAFVVVTQSWMTAGGNVPNLPSLTTMGGTNNNNNNDDTAYTDIDGVPRLPAISASMDATKKNEVIESMLGMPIAKSKEKCLLEVLRGGNEQLDDGDPLWQSP